MFTSSRFRTFDACRNHDDILYHAVEGEASHAEDHVRNVANRAAQPSPCSQLCKESPQHVGEGVQQATMQGINPSIMQPMQRNANHAVSQSHHKRTCCKLMPTYSQAGNSRCGSTSCQNAPGHQTHATTSTPCSGPPAISASKRREIDRSCQTKATYSRAVICSPASSASVLRRYTKFSWGLFSCRRSCSHRFGLCHGIQKCPDR